MYVCKILSPIPIDTQEPTNKQLSTIQAINNMTTMHASGDPKIKVLSEPKRRERYLAHFGCPDQMTS
jgi:hypothetical protein